MTPITSRPDPLAGAQLRSTPRPRYGDGSVISCDGLVRIYKLADLEVVALKRLDLLVEGREIVGREVRGTCQHRPYRGVELFE